MFCSNCGNQIPDNVSFCTVCGARINYVNANGAVTNQQPYMQAQQEHIQPGYAQQYNYAPAAEPQPPKKSNAGVKVVIAVAAVVAVVAIVFAVLIGTGTISFDKKSDGDDSETGLTIKEPEIGSVSDLPCIEGDRTADKIMMKMKTTGTGDGEFIWVGADYADPSEPKIYYELAMYSELGTITMQSVMFGDKSYMMTNFMPGQTLEGDSDNLRINMLFGDYSGEIFSEGKAEFKYLGLEEVTTGTAYVYEFTVEGEEGTTKIWIDTDTGYWVKTESDREEEIHIDVAEIITGDEIEFPEFDYENAQKGTKDEDF